MYAMRRFGLLVGIVLIALFPAMSQELIESDTSRATITGLADLYNDEFNQRSSSIDSSEFNQIESMSVSVNSGELVIGYSILDPGKRKEQTDHSYFATIVLKHGGKKLFVRPDKVVGHIFSKVGSHEGEKQIILTSLLEDYVGLEKEIEVELIIIHDFKLVEIPVCAEGPPQWRAQQKLPFIMGAVGGAGLIALGTVLEVNAQDTYSVYKTETDKNRGDALYDEANKNHKRGLALIYSGVGVMAADAIWFFVRKKRYKREKYLYENYCPNARGTVGLTPYWEAGSLASSQGAVGLKFTYTFE